MVFIALIALLIYAVLNKPFVNELPQTGSSYVAFVSSQSYMGDLGGLSGADAKCQALATAAGLSGTYKAWLSTNTEDAINRIIDTKYVDISGAVIADSKADIIDGTLQNPLEKTETGETNPNGIAFTGTLANGTREMNNNCANWTSKTTFGNAGFPSSTASFWTDAQSYSCSNTASLYCFQVSQPNDPSPTVTPPLKVSPTITPLVSNTPVPIGGSCQCDLWAVVEDNCVVPYQASCDGNFACSCKLTTTVTNTPTPPVATPTPILTNTPSPIGGSCQCDLWAVVEDNCVVPYKASCDGNFACSCKLITTPTPTLIPGSVGCGPIDEYDILGNKTGDDKVTFQDFIAFSQVYLKQCNDNGNSYLPCGGKNRKLTPNDSAVDFQDFIYFGGVYLEPSCSTGLDLLPETGSGEIDKYKMALLSEIALAIITVSSVIIFFENKKNKLKSQII